MGCGASKCSGAQSPDKDGFIADEHRKSQNVLCCLIFLLFWIGMIVIGGVGLAQGQPQRLIYGSDYRGDTCGTSPQKDQSLIVYPRVNEDFIANLGQTNPLKYKFYGVCVKQCPNIFDVVCNYEKDTNGVSAYSDSGIYSQTVKRDCLSGGSDPSGPTGPSCSFVRSNCWVTAAPTKNVLFRCVPSYNVTSSLTTTCVFPEGVSSASDGACIIAQDNRFGIVQRPAKPNMLFDQLNSYQQVWARWFGDLYRAWWVVLLCAVGGGLVLGFLWVFALKYITGCMVWSTIALTLVILSVITGYFYYKSGLVADYITLPNSVAVKLTALSDSTGVSVISPELETGNYKTAYEVIAFISTAVTVIVFCIVIYLRSSIKMAIDVIGIGADALRHNPDIVFFPLSTIVALACWLVWWVFVAACLATSGNITATSMANDVQKGLSVLTIDGYSISNTTISSILESPTVNATYSVYASSSLNSYLLIYHFFGLLWTTQFIEGISSMTIIGAVCCWYFSLNEAGNPNLKTYVRGPFSTLRSLYRTLRYYMGSIATASFLIAFLQMVRAILAYIQRQLKSQGQNSATLRFLFCCAQCCLKCLQTCVEMINRNAYVYIALKGYGYCEAVRSVFGLIVSYTAVLMFVNVLSEIMVFLGKALITAACGWFAYAILDNYAPFQTGGAQQISSTWLVILVTMFFSYAVASAFMSVFDLAVDSVLICYITDIEENAKRGGARVPAHVRADKFAFKAAKLGNEEEKAQRLAEPQESYSCCGSRPAAAPAQPAPVIVQAVQPVYVSGPQVAGANPMRPAQQGNTQSYYA